MDDISVTIELNEEEEVALIRLLRSVFSTPELVVHHDIAYDLLQELQDFYSDAR